MKITRKRRQMDGEFFDQEKVIDVPIKAGWKAGTKLTYAGEGDEEPNKLPSGRARFYFYLTLSKYFELLHEQRLLSYFPKNLNPLRHHLRHSRDQA